MVRRVTYWLKKKTVGNGIIVGNYNYYTRNYYHHHRLDRGLST